MENTTGLLTYWEFQRFIRKTKQDPNSTCILWTGSTTKNGYGKMWLRGRLEVAHRIAYLACKGPLLDEFEIGHNKECVSRLCVNGDHLTQMTYKENIAMRKPCIKWTHTHCRRGHLLDDANLYVSPAGVRQCLTCRRNSEINRIRK